MAKDTSLGVCELDSNGRESMIVSDGTATYQHWGLPICKYRSRSASNVAALEGEPLCLTTTGVVLNGHYYTSRDRWP